MAFSLPITDPAGIFFIVLALILLAHFLTDHLKMPAIASLVAAGLVTGPSVLNLVAKGAVIQHLGEIGIVFVFFLLGADLDFAKLKRARSVGAGYGLLLSLLPFALCTAAFILLFGYTPLKAVFLGLIVASQSLLPSSFLQKLGLSKSRPALAAEGATELTEALRIAALVILAADWRKEGSAFAWLIALGTIAAYALLLSFALPRFATLFFKRAKANDTVEFIFVLALAFLCSYLGRVIGLEPFAGAFIAGILLGRFFPEKSSLEKRLRFAGEWLFIPFFFVALGMELDLKTAASGWTLLVYGISLTLIVLAAKLGAAFLMRPLAGFSRTESFLAFGLTASQTVSAGAVAGIAYNFGALDDSLLAAVVITSLASSVIAPFVARAAGGRLALEEGRACASCEGKPARVLVGLSNPARIESLMDLAFLFRKRGASEALLPVSIVLESEDNELELSKAEGILAKAIVQANEANVPVEPQASVASNAAEGFRRAAAEKGANTIIVGWSRAPKFSRALFGSVIEQVLETSPELVVVAKTERPVRDISRVILVLPPLIEKHPGYERGLEALSSFLGRSGAHLSIMAQTPAGQTARDAGTRLRARGQVQVTELASWKEAGRAAETAGGGNSAFAVFCVRPGGPAWHPAVEKLPHILADEYPQAPLLLLYLPEVAAWQDSGKTEEDKMEKTRGDIFERALEAGRVIPAMKETAITDGIRELLRKSFGANRKTLARLASQLTEIAQKAPIELEPGILLLHAHVPEVTEPLVFFGSRPEGFRILALENPARVLVVLCSPEGLPPETHLATLGEIAKLFKDAKLSARLLEAKSASELGGETERIEEDEIT